MTRNITIYTDASHCQTTFAAGWACWIKADGRPGVLKSGAFRERIVNSNQAEMGAVANGIVVARHVALPQPGDFLIIVTDCEHVQAVLNGARRMLTKTERRMLDFIRRMVADLGCTLRANKVKAHDASDGARSWVNGLVDSSARHRMRLARKGSAA